MKSNEVADESYSINGFKHFSDLAVAYFKWQVHRPPAKKCVIVSKQVML